MKKSFAIILSLLFSVLLGQVVFAESTPAFTYDFTTLTNAEGPNWKFKLKAGEIIQDSFIVKNLDPDRTIDLKPMASEVEPSPYIDPSWITLPGIITLKPLESKIVPFLVTIPQGTEAKKYTGSLKVILTNYYGVTGGGIQVFVGIGKMLYIEVLPTFKVPPVTLTGKSYKYLSKSGFFLDWEDLPQLGTDFDKYNIKFKKGYYSDFTNEVTANSYVSFGSYYNLVGIDPGYIWTFQVVPVKKIGTNYIEVSDKSNLIHCKSSNNQSAKAYTCSYLNPAEAAAIGINP